MSCSFPRPRKADNFRPCRLVQNASNRANVFMVGMFISGPSKGSGERWLDEGRRSVPQIPQASLKKTRKRRNILGFPSFACNEGDMRRKRLLLNNLDHMGCWIACAEIFFRGVLPISFSQVMTVLPGIEPTTLKVRGEEITIAPQRRVSLNGRVYMYIEKQELNFVFRTTNQSRKCNKIFEIFRVHLMFRVTLA